MSNLVRGVLVAVGILLMLAGLALIVGVGGFGTWAGLQLVAFGAFLVVVIAIERHRYRSDAAEQSNDATGPGGGEPGGVALEPRFRPTAEVFIDPTTGRRMRVLIDPSTGERRYVAEA
jgi:membrane protein implicated in regulation of membrane protease activity